MAWAAASPGPFPVCAVSLLDVFSEEIPFNMGLSHSWWLVILALTFFSLDCLVASGLSEVNRLVG